MVATEEQAVFFQHQAQVVGGVAWCVDHAQGVAVLRALQDQLFAIGQFAFVVPALIIAIPLVLPRGEKAGGAAVSLGSESKEAVSEADAKLAASVAAGGGSVAAAARAEERRRLPAPRHGGANRKSARATTTPSTSSSTAWGPG